MRVLGGPEFSGARLALASQKRSNPHDADNCRARRAAQNRVPSSRMELEDPAVTVLSAVAPVRPVFRESTMQSALDVVRESGAEFVPVVEGGYLVGAVSTADLTSALLSGASPLDRVDILIRDPITVLPNCTIRQAMARMRDSRTQSLIVADADGRYVGVLRAMSLFSRFATPPSPGLLGGMATPSGVYLTNGEVTGGAKPIALTITGALLLLSYFLGVAITYGGLLYAEHTTGGAFVDKAIGGIGWAGAIMQLAPVLLFLLLIRVSPIAGTHAAEHMVVHTIERREPLTYEVVSRMPRVHPRCGTNIAVGAMMFMILLDFGWRYLGQIGPLFALAFTILTWRSVGGVVQYLVTTKPPSRKQVETAIVAANELLQNYRHSNRLSPGFWRRLGKSGLPYVLLGAMIASGVAMVVVQILGSPIPLW